MRLLLDADLSPRRLGDPLRERGFDVRALAGERDLEGLSDHFVLALATDDARVLVTRNCRDFAAIAREWAEGGRTHAGVILVWSLTSRDFGAIANGVAACVESYPDPAEWRGLVVAI